MEKFFCPASMGNVGLVDDNVVFTQCAIEYSMVWARGGALSQDSPALYLASITVN